MPSFNQANSLRGQMCTASISFISSLFIAGGIIRSDGGLTSPYRRIIFGISLSDILQSLAVFFGPFSVPKSVPVGIWAMGNDFTCRTNGFFMTFTAGSTPMYMFGLCLYTTFKVTTARSDEEFCRKYEKKMHLAIFSINLALSVFGLATKSIASSVIGNLCLVASSPTGCRQSPELVGECEQEIDYVLPLAIITSVGISFLSLLGIICCMAIICIYNLKGKRFNLSSISFDKGSTSSRKINHSDPAKLSNPSGDVNCGSKIMMPPSQALAGGESRQGDDRQKRSQDDSMVVSLNHKTVQQSDEIATSTSNAAAQISFSLIQFYRKEIILQACLFVVASLVTFSCYWALNVQVLILEDAINLNLLFAAVLTYPLGGFFNMFAYTRPKIAYFRSRHPEYSLLRALWHVIKTGGDVRRQEPIQDRDAPGDLLRNATRVGDHPHSVAFGVAQHIPAGGVLVDSSMLCRTTEPSGHNTSNVSALARNNVTSSISNDNIEHRINIFEAGLSLPRKEQNIHLKGSNNLDFHTGGSEAILEAADEGSIAVSDDRPTVRASNHFEDSQYATSFNGDEDLVDTGNCDEKGRSSSSALKEQGDDFEGYSDLDLLRSESDILEDHVKEEEIGADTDPVRRAYAKAMNRVRGLQ